MLKQLENFTLKGESYGTMRSFSWNPSGSFLAVNYTCNPSVIHIFDGKNHKDLISSLLLPGTSPDTSRSIFATFSWVPGEGSSVLAAVSSVGHLSFYTVDKSFQVRKKHLQIPFTLKLASRAFQGISFSKSGDFCVLISGHELVVLRRSTKTSSNLSYEFSSKSIIFALNDPDCVLSADVHPSGTAIALTSAKRNSVLILSIHGDKNVPSEIHTQLSKLPLEDDRKTIMSPQETEWFAPCVLNEIKLTGRRGPVSVSWSKYGDSLAFASSDNLLSVWNVPSRQIDTVALDETIVIRSLAFLNDMYLAICINDTNRILIVNVDDGILYDSNESLPREGFEGSKCKGFDFTVTKKGIVLARSGKDGSLLARWQLSVN